MQLGTQEKEEFEQEHPEFREIMEIINWIDENNISPYLINARDIKQWVEQNQFAKLPSRSSKAVEEEKQEITKALKKYKPQSILILGTSDGMVDKIAANLGLPEISERVYITDVATEQEMQTARKIRVTEGKHVIPVPTFEIKKDFSGYLLDPLQIFKSKGRGQKPYISEKSIIRPTFSYLGNFTISDTVFRQILDYLANNTKAINRVMKTRVDNLGEGVDIYMEVEVVYGFNVMEGLTYFKQKAKKEIEKLTAMNVVRLEVIAKSVYVPEKKEEK